MGNHQGTEDILVELVLDVFFQILHDLLQVETGTVEGLVDGEDVAEISADHFGLVEVLNHGFDLIFIEGQVYFRIHRLLVGNDENELAESVEEGLQGGVPFGQVFRNESVNSFCSLANVFLVGKDNFGDDSGAEG